jgi:hypothetical protein
MTEYFAVLDDFDRRGPFSTMREPVALIKQASKDLGHTEKEAPQFFLYQSAVERKRPAGCLIDKARLISSHRSQVWYQPQHDRPSRGLI